MILNFFINLYTVYLYLFDDNNNNNLDTRTNSLCPYTTSSSYNIYYFAIVIIINFLIFVLIKNLFASFFVSSNIKNHANMIKLA